MKPYINHNQILVIDCLYKGADRSFSYLRSTATDRTWTIDEVVEEMLDDRDCRTAYRLDPETGKCEDITTELADHFRANKVKEEIPRDLLWVDDDGLPEEDELRESYMRQVRSLRTY